MGYCNWQKLLLYLLISFNKHYIICISRKALVGCWENCDILSCTVLTGNTEWFFLICQKLKWQKNAIFQCAIWLHLAKFISYLWQEMRDKYCQGEFKWTTSCSNIISYTLNKNFKTHLWVTFFLRRLWAFSMTSRKESESSLAPLS